MKIIKLDSSDVKALDHISQTKPPNRFVYPQFGVSNGESGQDVIRTNWYRSISASRTSNKLW